MMCAGTFGKQSQLLLLDAILNITSGAIEFIVEVVFNALEISDNEARILSLSANLHFSNRFAAPLPSYFEISVLFFF
jgi:hypothetical protein